MSLTLFAVIAVVVMLAAFVQGTTGVGFALIVAPTLAFAVPDLLPACLLMLMIPLNVYVAWRERAALDHSGAGWITAGRFLGTFGGLRVLTALTSSQLICAAWKRFFAASEPTWNTRSIAFSKRSLNFRM